MNDWTIKQNDGVVDDKIIDIENTTGTLLPETGGMGTVIFTVIAVVMILGIAVSFVISRRKTCLIIYNSDIWMRGLPSGSLPIRYNSRENEIKMRRKKTEKKQFYIGDIFRVIGLIIAFSVLLYPTVSNYLYEKNGSKVISAYDENAVRLSESDKREMLEAARQYNEELLGNIELLDPFFIYKESATMPKHTYALYCMPCTHYFSIFHLSYFVPKIRSPASPVPGRCMHDLLTHGQAVRYKSVHPDAPHAVS